MSPKNKKSLLIATFLRLGIVASSPDRRLRSESAAKWLYCGSFPLCGSEGESPIAKKLQKARYFCFCDWLIVAMGQTPPMMNRIRTEIRACACRATKKPPEGGFVLNYDWASRIPALCERSPPWRKRLQANPQKRATGTFSLRGFTSSVRTLCIRQGNKKPPEGGFVLKYMAGPAGFEPT